MTTGLFDMCIPPEMVKPGMVMWAPEFGKPMTVKSIEPIAPNPLSKRHRLRVAHRIHRSLGR